MRRVRREREVSWLSLAAKRGVAVDAVVVGWTRSEGEKADTAPKVGRRRDRMAECFTMVDVEIMLVMML